MELKTWAAGGFERFECVWKFDDFWKRSNTFHAFLCFVDAAERNWPGDPEVENMSLLRKEMIDANSTYFDGIIGSDWVWSDDYGWCGISCLAAYDYLRRVGDQVRASDYLARAERCWKQMRETGYDATDQARPVPHGCGNVSPQGKITQGYGTKNTVTNTNLLLLSLRLYNAVNGTDPTRAEQYLAMVYAQYLWFGTWFLDNYQSEDDGHYLRRMPGPNYLIHERPMAKPDYVTEIFPTWERGWVWTGDQGLLVAGLAELLFLRDDLRAWTSANQMPGFDPAEFENSIRSLISDLMSGMMILFNSPDRVLREPPFKSSFGSEYGLDYVSGRGVLLRYVSEKSVQQVLGSRFHPTGIAATAEAVWNSRKSENQYSRKSENQFSALWNKANDAAFNKMFVDWWGSGDSGITEWDFGIAPLDKVHGVLQGLGLDALTAAMRYNLT